MNRHNSDPRVNYTKVWLNVGDPQDKNPGLAVERLLPKEGGGSVPRNQEERELFRKGCFVRSIRPCDL